MFKWSAILTVVLSLLSGIPVAEAQLAAVDPGPYTAASGYFPRWYQDIQDTQTTKGTKLGLCLSKALSSRVPGPGNFMCTLLPTPGIFDTGMPIVFPSNFPDESFWMLAETSIDNPGNGLELEVYVAGIEAAFANEVPRVGEQQSFARIRIRASVPVVGTYKVTHPYGVDTFNVTTAGRRAINMTRDIGIGAPGNFSGAQQGDIGPFLRSVRGPYVETNPVTQQQETFVGDPNLQEEVTGSPYDTNYVRIEGPGDRRIETKLFNLSGMLPTAGVATPLSVNSAIYSRNDTQGTLISVFASSSNQASLCLRESLEGLESNPPSLCPFPMVGDGNGHFYGKDPAPPLVEGSNSLPPLVYVTAIDNVANTTATSQSQRLTDQVKISRAHFSWSSKTLTVEARSSDELAIPSMVAEGFGILSGTTPTQSLVAKDIEQPPATVTVRSALGGSDTEFVVVEGSPASSNPLPVPVAKPDSASTTAGVPITLALTANDTGSNLSIDTYDTSGGAFVGDLVRSGYNALKYTPPLQVASPQLVTFTYQVKDSAGTLSNSAMVTITVSPNRAPVTLADTATTSAGASVVIRVLDNDTDPDGNALILESLTSPATARGSVVMNADGTVTYTPPASVTSTLTETFSYVASDSLGLSSAPTTVTVTVNPAETLRITLARVKTNKNRYSWDIQGTTTRPGPTNPITIEVTTPTGPVQLGSPVTAGANGRWSRSVNNTTLIVPSTNPRVTARSSLSNVTAAVDVR